VPLRQLGHGYQTLIAWMVDLASRMVERYPDSVNPLAEPAIVLVDEIDLHLHPTWQRKLIPMLTERFPNTQFIATAHSPLVVQAAGDANLAVLRREGDQVVIDNEVEAIRGWRIDQIYTSELFGVPSARPPEFDEPIKRRKQLLLKAKRSTVEEKELERLTKEVMGMPGGRRHNRRRPCASSARRWRR
jgi:predicted ATP-binding protein involved in virulence